jgi:hypothetical protein
MQVLSYNVLQVPFNEGHPFLTDPVLPKLLQRLLPQGLALPSPDLGSELMLKQRICRDPSRLGTVWK